MQFSDIFAFRVTERVRWRAAPTRLPQEGQPTTVLSGLLPSQLRSVATTLGLATLLIRLPNFGNPTYHVDEAFYLLVGQSLVDGATLYVDVWDRKPAGLFLLYALMAKLGGVLIYQAIAGLFAWATALTIAQIVRTFAGSTAAVASGIVYLAMLSALAGGGGQSPVFYNLFVAVAALLVLRQTIGRAGEIESWGGQIAMLLCGIALTIKPTVLPEGVFLGLMLLATCRRAHRSVGRLWTYAAQLGAAALAPSVLIIAYFFAAGQLDAYWYATTQSIFLTEPPAPRASAVRLAWLAHIIWVPAVIGIGGIALSTLRAASEGGRSRPIAIFIAGWLMASTAGFLMVPNFYDHYALPLAVTLAIACAPVFDRRRSGVVTAAFVTIHLLLVSGFPFDQLARKAAAQDSLTRANTIIARHINGGCLFVFDATPALYRPFDRCLGTRFAFPEHLSNQREARAIGADPVYELGSVLRRSPSVIALPKSPSVSTPNLLTWQRLRQHLAVRYRNVGTATLVDVVGSQQVEIWALGLDHRPIAASLP